jgi:DNA transposition AAA+ family ATPase
MAAVSGARSGTFLATKEHRRFVEFADAVRKHHYIGLCYGAAGVGKTLSGRRYARWDVAEPLLDTWGPRAPSDAKVYAALAQSRTIFYTPVVACSLRRLRDDIAGLSVRVDACIGEHLGGDQTEAGFSHGLAELLIVDEAERLSTAGLEHLLQGPLD